MSSPPAPPEPRADAAVVAADYETTFRFLNLLFEGVDQGFVEFQYSLPGKIPDMLREALSPVAEESSGLVLTVDELRGRGLDGDVLESIITGRDLPRRVAVSPIAGTESGADFRLAFHLFEKGFREGKSNGSWPGGDDLSTKELPEGYTASEDGTIR